MQRNCAGCSDGEAPIRIEVIDMRCFEITEGSPYFQGKMIRCELEKGHDGLHKGTEILKWEW
jgi:hypothetical protein